jgi:hypothetical protein
MLRSYPLPSSSLLTINDVNRARGTGDSRVIAFARGPGTEYVIFL